MLLNKVNAWSCYKPGLCTLQRKKKSHVIKVEGSGIRTYAHLTATYHIARWLEFACSMSKGRKPYTVSSWWLRSSGNKTKEAGKHRRADPTLLSGFIILMPLIKPLVAFASLVESSIKKNMPGLLIKDIWYVYIYTHIIYIHLYTYIYILTRYTYIHIYYIHRVSYSICFIGGGSGGCW